MRYYEAIFIVQPNLEQEGLSRLINETEDMFKKRGGEILHKEVMGKKRLAYSIQKQRFGTYVLLQFKGDGTGNARLNKDLELKDDILAHMIVRIDEDDIRKASMKATDTAEEELLATDEEELATGSKDETLEPVVDEQDEAEPESGQEQSPPDEQIPPSGEEDLEQEVKE